MMNKFLIFVAVLLAGCGANQYEKTNQIASSNPTDIRDGYSYSTNMYGSNYDGPSANVVVLLPMTGNNKTIGNNIKTSIETAFLRKPNQNIHVSFYDLSGTKTNKYDVMQNALGENPDVIIGPIFAEDAITLREIKPSKTPVISFTSDVSALGDNIMTMNLIPTQSIETIMQQMLNDGVKSMIILAPDDKSGGLMASVANRASSVYDIKNNGLFYYTPNNSESIKETAKRASMYNARNAANTRAREVLSDILTRESLTPGAKYNMRKQLEKISRTETLGDLPYDAILFLGNGEDSKTLVSFLRYYGVGNRDAAFYGTTLWNNSDITSDFTMSGAKYATLPEISDGFNTLYSMMSGHDADLLSAFGYDAANLALGMIYSNKDQSSYFFDPSGYNGTTGVFRIQPTGESERALRVMELNGSGIASMIKPTPTNFLVPLYNVKTTNLRSVPEKELVTRGINPGDYINIPEELRKKSAYKTKTFGAHYIDNENENSEQRYAPIQIYESDTSETVSNPEYEPVELEKISREYIDSVEINE